MNVLMIEVRAESFFAFCCDIMRDGDAFPERRAEAAEAADMVERIRTDEAIHVGYLQTTVSEMRSFTFKTVDGGTVKGKDLIDPIWEGMVHWHSVTQADFSREQTREAIQAGLAKVQDGAKLFAQFDKLDDMAKAA